MARYIIDTEALTIELVAEPIIESEPVAEIVPEPVAETAPVLEPFVPIPSVIETAPWTGPIKVRVIGKIEVPSGTN
jgi:hypothetical protein